MEDTMRKLYIAMAGAVALALIGAARAADPRNDEVRQDQPQQRDDQSRRDNPQERNDPARQDTRSGRSSRIFRSTEAVRSIRRQSEDAMPRGSDEEIRPDVNWIVVR